MIRVAVVGAGGRMGQESCRAVIADPGMELVAAVDPNMAGIDLRQVIGGDVPALQVAGTVDSLEDAAAQVAIEFSIAAATREHLEWYAAHGVHAVVGTTGLSEEDLAKAGRTFDSSNAHAVIAANFAIGAVLLMRFCELAAPFMEGVEVIELHHNAKADAPSGTAMRTAERMARGACRRRLVPAAPRSDHRPLAGGRRRWGGARRGTGALGAASGARGPPRGDLRCERPEPDAAPRLLRSTVVHARRATRRS